MESHTVKDISVETVNNFLKPFRMKLRHIKYSYDGCHMISNEYVLKIVDHLDNVVYGIYDGGYSSPMITYATRDHGIMYILEKLKEVKQFSIVEPRSYRKIANPYFSCHSLEEMMIKRDLIVA